MPNDALRRALHEAKLSERELAQRCKVDPKTVGRWLADPARYPHPRHRWAASNALGVDETVLWPEVASSTLKLGPDREIRQSWPYRNLMPQSNWQKLTEESEKDILYAGWTCYFLWLECTRLPELLRAKADQGCRVRFLIGSANDPATDERQRIENSPLTLPVRIAVTMAELSKLQDVPGVEVRHADRRLMSVSVFVFDLQAIVTPHLATTIGTDAPTMRLRRLQDDGLYDRFVRDHAEILWDDGQPVVW